MKLLKSQKRSTLNPSGLKVLHSQNFIAVGHSYFLNQGQVQIKLGDIALHMTKDEALAVAKALIEAADKHSESREF